MYRHSSRHAFIVSQKKQQDLAAASELCAALDAQCAGVESWAEQATQAAQAHVPWDTLDTARAHVASLRDICDVADSNEQVLEEMQLNLEKLRALGVVDCGAAEARLVAARELHESAATQANDKYGLHNRHCLVVFVFNKMS